MRIPTNAAELARIISLGTMTGIDPTNLKPATTGQGETQKPATTDDGRPLYRVPSIMAVEKNGTTIDGFSLKIVNLPTKPIPPTLNLTLVGAVTVTPWIRNGRIAYSVIAEGITETLPEGTKA